MARENEVEEERLRIEVLELEAKKERDALLMKAVEKRMEVEKLSLALRAALKHGKGILTDEEMRGVRLGYLELLGIPAPVPAGGSQERRRVKRRKIKVEDGSASG